MAGTATRKHRQQGMTFVGMVLLAIVVAFGAVVVIKVLPTLNEYYTTKKAINKIASSGVSSIPLIRREFENQRAIEYSISSVSGNDLEIDTTGNVVTISFAYDKEVEIIEPVFLLIKYRGSAQGPAR
ncbi:DUF4845 domain-containing protein [Ideonella sp.]|uniref:DUF4845 domain-containing protein n=1 Tax=Ideonella sp. TaxID=1929293 RepID=UPI003BB62936